MDYIALNIVPILAATVVASAAGLGFRGVTGGGMPGVPGQVVTLLALFWLAAILAGALLIGPPIPGFSAWTLALATPVVIFAGFVLPAIVATHVQRGLGAGAILTDLGYFLAVMVVEAAVMKAIGVTLPTGMPIPA